MKKETFTGIMNALIESNKRNSKMSEEINKVMVKYRNEQLDFISDIGVVFEDWNLQDIILKSLSLDFDKPDVALDIISSWYFNVTDLYPIEYKIYDENDDFVIIATADDLYDYLTETL